MTYDDIEEIKRLKYQKVKTDRAINNAHNFHRRYKSLRSALSHMREHSTIKVRWAQPCLRNKGKKSTKSISIEVHSDFSTSIMIRSE